MLVLAATVEVVDFVEEGQAEAFLAMDIRERNKKHVYPEIEKVVNTGWGNMASTLFMMNNMNCFSFLLTSRWQELST